MSKTIPIFQVDAFADEPFRGNPAAVCLLDGSRDPSWMQAVAMEMNLSETAFVWPTERGYALKWFTPVLEVSLCGHATLATAHVLWNENKDSRDSIIFQTKSGNLQVERRADGVFMDFPARRVIECDLPKSVQAALNTEIIFVGRVERDDAIHTVLLELPTEEVVRALHPDLAQLRAPGSPSVLITARSSNHFDFVSRYFAPSAGVDEDPVTGSAHCALGPYWSEKLHKKNLLAFQASRRGGCVGVEIKQDRVILFGRAITTLRGELLV